MNERPVRVLHVVGGMNRGGVETWLMHVLRRVDRREAAMDFLAHVEEPCAYDEEILRLGAKVIRCPHIRRPLQYAHCLRAVLTGPEPYDVVHSHVHHYSGWVLHVARRARVRERIAHSHNDTRAYQRAAGPARKAYLIAMRHLLSRSATALLSCSEEAELALFGPRAAVDERSRVLKYGIALEGYARSRSTQRESIRSSLGISRESVVIGHVGRFVHQKNHPFLLEVFTELKKRVPEAHLLLVGGGQLEEQTKRLAVDLGVADSVTFAGIRADVEALMLHAMDAFVLPSHFEGLGLVLIEAQAAGLPCVVSDRVPPSAEVVPGLVVRLSLASSADAWAVPLAGALRASNHVDRAAALERVRASAFNIETSVTRLMEVYGAR